MSWVSNYLFLEKILFLLLSWWDHRLLTFLLPKFLNLYCLFLHWWIFTFWNALGFILDLLFLCIHLKWYHLVQWLEINLYVNDTRMSLDPPLDSRYILHISTWLSKKKPTPQQFPPHNKLVVCFIYYPNPKFGSDPSSSLSFNSHI